MARNEKSSESLHWVWQHPNWPDFRWDSAQLLRPLGQARRVQGELLSQARALGFALALEARGEILTEEAVQTGAIEGERYDRDAVRSSVGRRLGLPTAGLAAAGRDVEGLVEVLFDATSKASKPLTAERLQGWHAALFPTGYSGVHPIRIARWREGPMAVVSGAVGRERVHYEAPPAARVEEEMARYLTWWEAPPTNLEGVLRAAVAHFWFVAIHPFDDGNGRLARALSDMALAQDEGTPARFYSVSAQIMAERDSYYTALERTGRGDGDLTAWICWFLECFARAVDRSQSLLARVLLKAGFWQRHAQAEINARQRKVLNRLLDAGPDGFEGGLKTGKYAGMTGVDRATAYRDIADLVTKGLLVPAGGKGRAASYEVAWNAEEK